MLKVESHYLKKKALLMVITVMPAVIENLGPLKAITLYDMQ